MAVLCRHYKASDRTAIRNLCCATGNEGRPIQEVFPDCNLFADWWTRTYTDHLPEWVWVLEDNGEVFGYILGCPDTKGHQRWFNRNVLPAIIARLVLKGLIFRPAVQRIMLLWVWDWVRERPMLGNKDRAYPAHAHLQLAPNYQRQQYALLLGQELFAALRNAGVSGIHGEVPTTNGRMCSLLAQQGFIELRRYVAPGLRLADGCRVRIIVWGKRL